ncbi:MAG TPA: polysaccharide biosynthesis/export family protein [Candidatus Omnitrophota bacterium]|nr:polysaccharide biosynthesis/export family protein [Candidatus Omnitrophota bacterium]
MKKFYFVLPLAIALLIPQISFAEDKEPYRIGREDVLDVSVWGSQDLTQTVTVSSDGTFSYPILGNVPAAGLTPEQIANDIQEKLAQGYVKDPKVSVTVKEYNSKKILVFGEVEKPGLYKLKGKVPLLELLFMVGGVKPDAKRMTVIRPLNVDQGGEAVPAAMDTTFAKEGKEDSAQAIDVNLISLLSKGDLSQNVLIMPGDTIYVSSGSGERYYVLGQVKNPGPYEWIQDITVLEAIKLAGGPTDSAALNRINIRQNRGGQEQVIKLNVADIMQGKKKDDVVIKPGDVIVVPESWI